MRPQLLEPSAGHSLAERRVERFPGTPAGSQRACSSCSASSRTTRSRPSTSTLLILPGPPPLILPWPRPPPSLGIPSSSSLGRLGRYQRAILFVSPLLNATGIATKNFHAMAAGLPVLTTTMGTAGLLLSASPLVSCCGGEGGGAERGGDEGGGDEGEGEDEDEDGGAAPLRCSGGSFVFGPGAEPWPRVPSIAEDCAMQPSRMECKAWAAAKANPRRRPSEGPQHGADETAQQPDGTGGHQGPSEAVRGHQGASEAVRGHQGPPRGVRAHRAEEEVRKLPRKAAGGGQGQKATSGWRHAGSREAIGANAAAWPVGRGKQSGSRGGGARAAEADAKPRAAVGRTAGKRQLLYASAPRQRSRPTAAAAPTSSSSALATAPRELTTAPPRWLHRSGAIFVADDAVSFASAALVALGSRALWTQVSVQGVRHQRRLTPSRQSHAFARHLASAEIGVRLPAERACVLVCDSCEGGRRRQWLRRVLGALLRLRIAAHVLLLPRSTLPKSEERIMGWQQAQGVFFYDGVPEEQWSALLAAAPFPPPSLGIAMPQVLRDIARQLRSSRCLPPPSSARPSARPSAARCFWAGAAGKLAAEAAAVKPIVPKLLMGSSDSLDAEDHTDDVAAAADADADAADADAIVDDADADADTVDAGVHMLELVRCMRRDARLPLALLPLTLHARYRALAALEEGAASVALRRLLARYEDELLGQASALLSVDHAQGEAMQSRAVAVLGIPSERLNPRDSDAAWTSVLVQVLGL